MVCRDIHQRDIKRYELLDLEEEISVDVSTDLLCTGSYGTDWVLATEKFLIISISDGTTDLDTQDIALDEIASIDLQQLHGNDIMKVRTGDTVREVARYSKAYAPRCFQAASETESSIKKIGW